MSVRICSELPSHPLGTLPSTRSQGRRENPSLLSESEFSVDMPLHPSHLDEKGQESISHQLLEVLKLIPGYRPCGHGPEVYRPPRRGMGIGPERGWGRKRNRWRGLPQDWRGRGFRPWQGVSRGQCRPCTSLGSAADTKVTKWHPIPAPKLLPG